MKHYLKFFLITFLFPSPVLFAQSDFNYKGFRRFHFTLQTGYQKNKISEILTKTFAEESYQGTKSLLIDYVNIGGNPENASGIRPVLNVA